MSVRDKKKCPTDKPQSTNKNIHKVIITNICGFVKGLERVLSYGR